MPSVPKPSRRPKKKRLTPLPALVRKADKVFSLFIRKRDNYTCVTCGKPGNHAGHFVRRSHKRVRWCTYNVHCQCCHCNTFLDGNMDAYAMFMVNEYGPQVIAELVSKKGPYKPSREELEKIILAYSQEEP